MDSPGNVKALFEKIKAGGEIIDTLLEEYEDFVFFRCLDADKNKIEVYWE